MDVNFRSFSDLNNIIYDNIYKFQGEFDLIVGIPRSGMIPAYTLGLYLNLPVITLSQFLENSYPEHGSTRTLKNSIKKAQGYERILLVDDSISSGKSMRFALSKISEPLRAKIKTLCIFGLGKDPIIDYILENVSTPRVFEWNIFHHSLINEACVDIDGVLCQDPTAIQNDDGEKYVAFLKNAKPKIVPSVKIKYLVTNRLEKYRQETEKWLKENNVEYEKLFMLDLMSKDERIAIANPSKHKWNVFKNSNCSIFIESEIEQAKDISMRSGKAVFCTEDRRMYNPSLKYKLKNNKKSTLISGLKKFVKPFFLVLPEKLRVKLKNAFGKL